MGVSSHRAQFTPQLRTNSTLSSHRKWPPQEALLVPTELPNNHTQVDRLADNPHIQEDRLVDSLHTLVDPPREDSRPM